MPNLSLPNKKSSGNSIDKHEDESLTRITLEINNSNNTDTRHKERGTEMKKMAYNVNITRNAINDIYTFYSNVLLKYPNTWTVADAIAQANKAVDEMSSTIIYGLNGQRMPLLVNLQANRTVE